MRLKRTHEATKKDYATKEENAAKDSILAEAIKTTKCSDGMLLNPTQVGLALKVLDKESVKWEKKGDTFSVKNLDEIIAGLAKTEGLEFSAPQNTTVGAGSRFTQQRENTQTFTKSGTDNSGMNALIRGGNAT